MRRLADFHARRRAFADAREAWEVSDHDASRMLARTRPARGIRARCSGIPQRGREREEPRIGDLVAGSGRTAGIKDLPEGIKVVA